VFSWELSDTVYVNKGEWVKDLGNKRYFGFPILDIVNNFPVPLIWTRKYRANIKKLSGIVKSYSEEDFYVITHTRFFLSSFLGGRFARKHKLKWIHIEHGSDYVKLSSNFKNKIAYLYDRTIWKYIFKRADRVLAISAAAQKFIKSEFWVKKSNVWYRGIDFPQLKSQTLLKDMFPDKIIIWYVWRLYKWKNVSSLISAYYNIKTDKNVQLVIVWDGEDYRSLKKQDVDNIVYFTGWVDEQSAYQLQSEFDIHVHPSSPGWGLATTLLQAMNLDCMIVATPYEWAKEVIVDWLNWTLLKDDSISEIQRWIEFWVNNIDLSKKFSDYNTTFIQNNCNTEKNIKILYEKL